MRLLVLSYSYYPYRTPRAYRWTSICEHWAEMGISVDVITSCTQTRKQSEEMLNGVNIYRVNDPLQFFREDPRAKDLKNNSLGSSNHTYTQFINYLLSKLKKIVNFFRWPDYAWAWLIPAHRKLRILLEEQKYNGIISVAHPFTSHFVVWLLKNKIKTIPWVCDYGDPFSLLTETPLNNTTLFGWLNQHVEKKVMLASGKVAVTTNNTATEYKKLMQLDSEIFHIIPPLIPQLAVDSNLLIKSNNKLLSAKKNTFKLAFFGTLYMKIRNPRSLLCFLRTVQNKLSDKNIEIHFFGAHNECAKIFEEFRDCLGKWIFLHGYIERSHLASVYFSNDMLVNIGNTTNFQLPSKVIEYISTGMPILNFSTCNNDLSAEILKEYPNAFSVRENSAYSEEIVNNFCFFLLNATKLPPESTDVLLRNYKINSIAGKYLQLIID